MQLTMKKKYIRIGTSEQKHWKKNIIWAKNGNVEFFLLSLPINFCTLTRLALFGFLTRCVWMRVLLMLLLVLVVRLIWFSDAFKYKFLYRQRTTVLFVRFFCEACLTCFTYSPHENHTEQSAKPKKKIEEKWKFREKGKLKEKMIQYALAFRE